MIKIRSYTSGDAGTVISWCRDETEFYLWTAGVLGDWPLTAEKFAFVESLIPFIAYDESGPFGFFTLRDPGKAPGELRIGFVIVNPKRRGAGLGSGMLRLGIERAFGCMGAERVTLGVFESNAAALRCYKAAGFRLAENEPPEYYSIHGRVLKCVGLAAEKTRNTGE